MPEFVAPPVVPDVVETVATGRFKGTLDLRVLATDVVDGDDVTRVVGVADAVDVFAPKIRTDDAENAAWVKQATAVQISNTAFLFMIFLILQVMHFFRIRHIYIIILFG